MKRRSGGRPNRYGRPGVLLVGIGLLWLVGLIAIPISNVYTRWAFVIVLGLLVLGVPVLCWRYQWRRLSYGILAFYALLGAFVSLPGRAVYDRVELRGEVARAIRRYEGVRYVWGGEGQMGIDCSGLIRRGIIEGTFRYGLRAADPKFIRKSIWIWWHDMSAREMGSGALGLAHRRMVARAITQVNDSTLVPGDFAITANGVHALAFVGDHTWVEADPNLMRVVRVPDGRNPGSNAWFQCPVNLMRWKLLDPPQPGMVH